MLFAKNMAALPKRQQLPILMLEGSLTGAANLAKQAAKQATPPTNEDTTGEDGRTESGGTDTQDTAPKPPRNGTDKQGGPSDWVADSAQEEPEEEPTVEEIVDAHNKAIESFCRELRKAAKAKPELEWLDHKGRWDGFFRKVCQGLDTLRSAKAVVCPACEGETCKECDGHGYLPKVEAEGVQ